MDWVRANFKAIGGAVVGVASYVVAFGLDVSDPKWWAAGVVFLGAGYGIVWATPANKARS